MERSERGEQVGRPGWRRLRSGALLLVLVLGLGVASAAIIGILAVALATLVDQGL